MDQLFNLVIVAGLLAIVWAVLRPSYVFLIRIDNGAAKLAKGRVAPEFLSHVGDICAERGITRGWIGGIGRGRGVRLVFSHSIPSHCRQQLRNVWAFQR